MKIIERLEAEEERILESIEETEDIDSWHINLKDEWHARLKRVRRILERARRRAERKEAN